jgi:para-nitrobenzyl esterase
MPAGTTPQSNLPVMVWIHGGAYRNGGCDGPSYDRSPLARENSVIVVGMNYRLGVLGFVRDQDGKPSNNGLLDLIEALLWVNRNISAFGGDPGNVTLFGQSAGADAIMRIMSIEGAELLYRRAIMQSAPLGTLAGRATMEAKMLEELNAVPANATTQQLRDAQASIVAHVTEKGNAKRMVFAPHFGVFPLPSEEEAKAQICRVAPDHELLIGAMAREVAAYIGTSKKFAALDRFPITRPVTERVIKRIGGEIFNAPIEEFARLYAEAGGTTFLYTFSWMQGESVLGASHCSDCLLLFGVGDAEGKPGCMGMSAQEVLETGTPFRKIWADFAKTGTVERTSLDGMIEIRKL